ncbi:lysophospholipase L1-like esterase [Rhizobium sp. BK312]|uniref:SGNH/GDSL hydrolase family protein n=1 Tax=Rhizobium sp. BK312 TaxID=2587080 RepID=UPI0013AF4E80|nr:SGNH/GDSL hydrolase family protein [Rhizobium sp. BK312]MBB3426661.1 lysophospholipase L1-like esterase [Rhizobium sp. BK312]
MPVIARCRPWPVMRFDVAIAFLFLSLCTFMPCFAAEAIERPSKWIGRVAASDAAFGWPGSGFALHFEGTSLSVTLVDTGKNSLEVELDGVPQRLDLQAGQHRYQLADGLRQGAHEIRATRRTEGWIGDTIFVSAETDGSFLPAEASATKLVAIGDSITAGYGLEGVGPGCKFSPGTENQYLTYAAVAARSLGMELTTLAVSGIGLSRTGKNAKTMLDVIDSVTPLRKGVPALPDERVSAVVVNLGTNDFSDNRNPSDFIEEYVKLIFRLRNQFPKAYLYAALGPMMSQKDFDVAEKAIEAVVQASAAKGETRLRYLNLRVKPKDFGCDWHPSRSTNAAMATLLEQAIRADWGPHD